MIPADPPPPNSRPEEPAEGDDRQSGVTRNQRQVHKEHDISQPAVDKNSPADSRKRLLDAPEHPPVRKSARTLKPVKPFEPVTNPPYQPSRIQWLTTEVTDTGRILVPVECLQSYKKYRLDTEPLRKQALETGFIPMVHTGHSLIEDAGKGVFATRDFKKGELIGFYQGRLTRHIIVSDGVVRHYSNLCKKNPPDEPEKTYATWYEDNGKTCFLKTPDSHILWSGVEVQGERIELGIDGLKGGNALASLNHNDDSNVRALPTFTKTRSHGRDTDLFATAGGYSAQDLLIPIVATKAIQPGEELTMTYRRSTNDPVDFAKVGNNVFSAAHLYFKAQQDDIELLTRPTAIDHSPDQTWESDFEKTLTAEEKRLIKAWHRETVHAQKKLVDRIQSGDEKALDLFIFLCLTRLGLTPADTIGSIDRLMGHYFRRVDELRSHVRTRFSNSDAAMMLKLRNVPGEKELLAQPASTSSLERRELLSRIRNNDADAKESLRSYLFYRLYCSDSHLPPADQHLFAGVAELIKKTPRLMGKKGNEWNEAALYQFALDEGIFLNDEDRIAFTPLSFLKTCLKPPVEHPETGLKALNEYVHHWVARGDPLYVLASLLSRYKVPNAVHPGEIWTEKHLLELQSMRLLYEQPLSDEILKEQLTLWLDNRNTKKGRIALQTVKSQLLNGSLSSSKLMYLMRSTGLSDQWVYKAISPFAEQYGIENVRHDAIQALSYQYMSENKLTFQQQAENLGSAINVIVQRVKSTGTLSQAQADTLCTKEELEQLRKELRDALKASSRNYSIAWYQLLRTHQIPVLYRILLEETVRIKDLPRVATNFTRSGLPRYAPKEEKSPTDWQLIDVIQNLHDNKIYDIRDGKGRHVAVMMAAELDVDMRFLKIDGKPFEEWLVSELREHTYAPHVISQLREKNYDAAKVTWKAHGKSKGKQ